MTIGAAAIGRRAWGTIDPAVARGAISPWQAGLSWGDADPIIAVEIDTWPSSGGGLVTRRYATHALTTGPYDAPPSTPIPGRLLPRIAIDQSVPSRAGGLLGGIAPRAIGEIALANGDGALDGLLAEAVDGRRVRVLLGGLVGPGQRVDELRPVGPGGSIVPTTVTVDRVRPAPWWTWGPVLETVGDGWEADLREVRLALQDAAALLRSPVQSRVYAGTGGAEGPQDLAGRARPLCYGRCLQVPPVLIDPQYLIYQVHDGPIRGVDAVYDSGVALPGAGTVPGGFASLVASDIAPGTFVVAPEAGLLRLGSPPAGVVTADVRGAIVDSVQGYERPWADGRYWADGRGWVGTAPGPGYVELPGSIVAALLARSGLSRGRIAVETLAELDEACPWRCGLWIGPDDRPTVEQAIDRVIGPLACVASPDRLGCYRVAALLAPSGTPPRVIDQTRIQSIEARPVPWRVTPLAIVIGWGRYWRTQSEGELAGAVEPERRAELGRAYRTVRVEVSGVGTLHPTARATDTIETALAEASGARELAERLAALHGPAVRRLTVRVRGLAIAELGEQLTIRHPRLGLADGRAALVIGLRADLTTLTTVLDVLVGGGT